MKPKNLSRYVSFLYNILYQRLLLRNFSVILYKESHICIEIQIVMWDMYRNVYCIVAIQYHFTPTLKRKGRQDDSPDIHWRHWRQASTSPVNTRAATWQPFRFCTLITLRLYDLSKFFTKIPLPICQFCLYRAVRLSTKIIWSTGLILGLCPANESQR